MSVAQQSPKRALDTLAWLAGGWHGPLGDKMVTEHWSVPNHGVMATKVEIAGPAGIEMFELISICEHNDSLILHLRQFSPQLELRLAQEMALADVGEQMVSFSAPGQNLSCLTYARTDDELEAKVQIGGVELAARLRAR